MSRQVRTAIKVLLTLMFLGSTGLLLFRGIQNQKGAASYAQAEELARMPIQSVNTEKVEAGIEKQTEEASVASEAPAEIDLPALQAVNSDVIGWLLIPDTPISYPLVQSGDNEYYLTHTWEKEANSVGAIFLEAANSPDFSDFHTVAYGHRMLDGSMFGSLKYYKNQEYAEEHPCIYLVDEAGSHCYEIFAAYETPVTGNTYQLEFSEAEAREKYLVECGKQSIIDTGIEPETDDRILTLSTCTGKGYDSRWIVQARLTEE